MLTVQELNEKRQKSLKEMRDFNEKVKSENRDFTAEEQATFDAMKADFQKCNADYQAAKSRDDVAAKQKERDEFLTTESRNIENDDVESRRTTRRQAGQSQTYNWQTDANRPHTRRRIDINTSGRGSNAYAGAFATYLLTGRTSQFSAAGIRPEDFNALQSDNDERGGYLVPDEQFVAGLLKEVDDQTFIQQMSRVIHVNKAQSLGIRKRVQKVNTFGWGPELQNALENLDTSLRFGKRILTPHYMTGSIAVSRDLIRSSVMDIVSIIREELGINASEVLEGAFLYADGVEKPLGLMVPSADGISTARDVSTGATVNTFDFDTLITAKYALKTKYRSKAKWLFHRDRVRDIALIKDKEDQYIWQPSKVVGDPDTALGLPVTESEWMPSTAGASNYFGLLGDFQYYIIAYALDMEVLRLDEIRARTNEVEFIARLKVDAMPVLEEAFVRLQYASGG